MYYGVPRVAKGSGGGDGTERERERTRRGDWGAWDLTGARGRLSLLTVNKERTSVAGFGERERRSTVSRRGALRRADWNLVWHVTEMSIPPGGSSLPFLFERPASPRPSPPPCRAHGTPAAYAALRLGDLRPSKGVSLTSTRLGAAGPRGAALGRRACSLARRVSPVAPLNIVRCIYWKWAVRGLGRHVRRASQEIV